MGARDSCSLRIRASAMLWLMGFCAVQLSASAGCEKGDTRASSGPSIVRLHLAYRVGTRAAEVRRRLGCDPCREASTADRGRSRSETYFFHPDVSLHILESDVVSASTAPTGADPDGGCLLVLTLTPEGRAKLSSYEKRHRLVMTMNEINGEYVGLNPLMVVHDQYIVGEFDDIEDASATAKAIGVRMEAKQSGQSEIFL